jgi:hypothetical protein
MQKLGASSRDLLIAFGQLGSTLHAPIAKFSHAYVRTRATHH